MAPVVVELDPEPNVEVDPEVPDAPGMDVLAAVELVPVAVENPVEVVM